MKTLIGKKVRHDHIGLDDIDKYPHLVGTISHTHEVFYARNRVNIICAVQFRDFTLYYSEEYAESLIVK